MHTHALSFSLSLTLEIDVLFRFLLDSDTIHPTMRSTVVDDSNGTRSLHTVLLLEWSMISEDDQQLPQIRCVLSL